MTTTYHFYSAGSIPGIPGIFAGVAVEVDDAGSEILNISPLSSNPLEIPAIEEIPPVSEEIIASPEIKEP